MDAGRREDNPYFIVTANTVQSLPPNLPTDSVRAVKDRTTFDLLLLLLFFVVVVVVVCLCVCVCVRACVRACVRV